MSNEQRTRVDLGGIAAPLWLAGWLFTVGFVHLALGRAVLALVLWPYYLGRALGH